MSFGQVIAGARKEKGLSQKELALVILKEDGEPISPQYLNDLERDRRNPPAGPLLEQLAEHLGLPLDYLYFLAGELPQDLRTTTLPPTTVKRAFTAFRKELKK